MLSGDDKHGPLTCVASPQIKMHRHIFIHGGDDYRIPGQLRQQQRRFRRTKLGLRNRCGGGDCSNSEAEAERVKSSAYVDFVNRVTTEILLKGIFTDRDGLSL